MQLKLDFWKNAPSKIKRIISIVAFFCISIIVTVAGVLTPLTTEEVNILGEDLSKTQKTVENLQEMPQISFIFGNNLMICLIGFTPLVGPAFEYYVLYSTGVVISAYSSYEQIQVNPLLLFFLLFLFPFTWLEFIAYSTAIAGSVWLTWRIINRKGRREIKNTCILISVCAVMLVAAAIIEALLL